MRYRQIFLVTLMVLLCAAPSYAGYVRAEGYPLVSPGVLPQGDVFIDLYMDNETNSWGGWQYRFPFTARTEALPV